MDSGLQQTQPGMPGIPDLLSRIEEHRSHAARRFRRWWDYYRNPQQPAPPADDEDARTRRPYVQAQEFGLPARLTGVVRDLHGGQTTLPQVQRKEIVVENDIAWRIDTQVDFLFGKPIVVQSAAANPGRRERIGQLLRHVLAANGGLQFFQRLALLGAVYGHVDVLVKLVELPDDETPTLVGGTQSLGEPSPLSRDTLPDASPASAVGDDASRQRASLSPSAAPAPAPADQPEAPPSPDASWQRLARRIRFEIVEPVRGLPLLDPRDATRPLGFVQFWTCSPDEPGREPTRSRRWFDRFLRGPAAGASDAASIGCELHLPGRWTVVERGRIVAAGRSPLRRLPLVHVQNIPLPGCWEGAGEVEPLVPLQDELNTRLSDRASRIAMQSFKMYLARGLEHFNTLPVGPGQMWSTSNENATILEFGGDASCPSEDAHIAEVREAMDKTSGVSPIAAGAIKGRIGRLTSAAALRVTLLALLARIERKRIVYGAAIESLASLTLELLDAAGLFATAPDERGIELHWPNPIPLNESERLDLARARIDLGVPRELVLRELGLPTG